MSDSINVHKNPGLESGINEDNDSDKFEIDQSMTNHEVSLTANPIPNKQYQNFNFQTSRNFSATNTNSRLSIVNTGRISIVSQSTTATFNESYGSMNSVNRLSRQLSLSRNGSNINCCEQESVPEIQARSNEQTNQIPQISSQDMIDPDPVTSTITMTRTSISEISMPITNQPTISKETVESSTVSVNQYYQVEEFNHHNHHLNATTNIVAESEIEKHDIKFCDLSDCYDVPDLEIPIEVAVRNKNRNMPILRQLYSQLSQSQKSMTNQVQQYQLQQQMQQRRGPGSRQFSQTQSDTMVYGSNQHQNINNFNQQYDYGKQYCYQNFNQHEVDLPLQQLSQCNNKQIQNQMNQQLRQFQNGRESLISYCGIGHDSNGMSNFDKFINNQNTASRSFSLVNQSSQTVQSQAQTQPQNQNQSHLCVPGGRESYATHLSNSQLTGFTGNQSPTNRNRHNYNNNSRLSNSFSTRQSLSNFNQSLSLNSFTNTQQRPGQRQSWCHNQPQSGYQNSSNQSQVPSWQRQTSHCSWPGQNHFQTQVLHHLLNLNMNVKLNTSLLTVSNIPIQTLGSDIVESAGFKKMIQTLETIAARSRDLIEVNQNGLTIAQNCTVIFDQNQQLQQVPLVLPNSNLSMSIRLNNSSNSNNCTVNKCVNLAALNVQSPSLLLSGDATLGTLTSPIDPTENWHSNSTTTNSKTQSQYHGFTTPTKRTNVCSENVNDTNNQNLVLSSQLSLPSNHNDQQLTVDDTNSHSGDQWQFNLNIQEYDTDLNTNSNSYQTQTNQVPAISITPNNTPERTTPLGPGARLSTNTTNYYANSSNPNLSMNSTPQPLPQNQNQTQFGTRKNPATPNSQRAPPHPTTPQSLLATYLRHLQGACLACFHYHRHGCTGLMNLCPGKRCHFCTIDRKMTQDSHRKQTCSSTKSATLRQKLKAVVVDSDQCAYADVCGSGEVGREWLSSLFGIDSGELLVLK